MYDPRGGSLKRHEEEETAGDLRLKLLPCFKNKLLVKRLLGGFQVLLGCLKRSFGSFLTIFIDHQLRHEYLNYKWYLGG